MLTFGGSEPERGNNTRVRRPPGGESKICLGWDDEERSTPRLARNSSNAFANGANQNCHNVITDVPTTRVKAPPGGRSSIQLGWDAEPTAGHTKAPPGGRSSINLGWDTEPQRAEPQRSNVFGAGEPMARTGAPRAHEAHRVENGRHRQRPSMLDDESEDEDAPHDEASSVSMAFEPRTPTRNGCGRTPAGHATAGGNMDAYGRTPPAEPSCARNVLCASWDDAPGFPPRTPPPCNGRAAYAPNPSGHTPRRGSAWDDASDCNAGPAPRTPTSCNRQPAPPAAWGRTPPPDSGSSSSAWDDARERHGGFAPRTPPSSSGQNPGLARAHGRASQDGSSSASAAWEEAPERNGGFAPRTPPCGPRKSASTANIHRGNESARPTPRSVNILAWEDPPERNITPRASASCARREEQAYHGPSWARDGSEATESRASEPAWAPFQRKMEGRAGKASFDTDNLKLLKARMGQKQSSAGVSTASGSQIYDQHYGFGNFSVPVDQMSQCQRSASAPRLRIKEEVEGSRPRKWKPAKNPQGPPGGSTSFHPAKDGEIDHKNGRKRFPDMGTGNNRDPNAVEALRFYQDEEKLGRQPVERRNSAANKFDRDSHRYYLAADGKADLTPGKSRPSGKCQPGGRIPGFNDRLTSQSTSAAGSGEDFPSECDSLPLGAEWSTVHSFEGRQLQPLMQLA